MGLGIQAEAEIDTVRHYAGIDVDKIKFDLYGVGLTEINPDNVAGAELVVKNKDNKDGLVEHGPINVSGDWTAVQWYEARNGLLGNTITLTLGDTPIANAGSEAVYRSSLKKYANDFLAAHPSIKDKIDETDLKEVRLVYRIAVPQAK